MIINPPEQRLSGFLKRNNEFLWILIDEVKGFRDVVRHSVVWLRYLRHVATERDLYSLFPTSNSQLLSLVWLLRDTQLSSFGRDTIFGTKEGLDLLNAENMELLGDIYWQAHGTTESCVLACFPPARSRYHSPCLTFTLILYSRDHNISKSEQEAQKYEFIRARRPLEKLLHLPKSSRRG